VKVRIALKVKDPRIVPEMGVRVSFLEEAAAPMPQRKPSVLATAAAIVERDGALVAFAIDEGRATQRRLTLGRALGDDREVLQGLNGGDTVVLDPPDALQSGNRVRIVRTGTETE